MALENTILKWSSDHRKHHSLSDTDDDPYTIKKGFWHAHIGWIIKNTDPDKDKIIGVKDLEKIPAVKFQNKYYFHIAFVGGVLLPFAIGFIYGRPIGALLWGTFLRITLVHHATFFINSLCHYSGKKTYDLNSTSRDSWFVSLFTFGEGYHNYHHKFPSDYRNGIKWYAYDPSKWLIKVLSYLKMTSNLIQTKDYHILESKLDVLNQKIKKKINKSKKKHQFDEEKNINFLIASANDILSKWKKIDLPNTTNSSKEKELIIKYRLKTNEIFNELRLFSSRFEYN